MVPSGSRSMLEFFLLESIVYIVQEGISLLPENTQVIYNTLAELLHTTETQLPVGTKEVCDITVFLHEHDLNLFQALCLSFLGSQHDDVKRTCRYT